MKQFKTLLISEYQKRKHLYWWPVWIVAGLTILSIIALLVAWIIERPDIIMYGTDNTKEGNLIGMYGTMFGLGTIFWAFVALITQSSLNRERQLGSDLFFRSQPVSFWKVTGAKYLMHLFGSSVLLLGLGIIFSLILSIVIAISSGGFFLGHALWGCFLGWLTYLKVVVVFGSLCFLFSAIFKNNALILGTATLGLLEGIFAIIEAIFKFKITLPSVFISLGKMVGSMGLDEIDEIKFSIVTGNPNFLLGLLFAAICFAGGSYIYKLRAKDI